MAAAPADAANGADYIASGSGSSYIFGESDSNII
jgi:hypothetical protein